MYVKKHIETEKPRKSRKRSAAFFMLFTQGSLLLSQSACAPKVSRSIAPADAPLVMFASPAPEARAVRGETIAFAVSVTGFRELVSVQAHVRGAINYQFPAANPADSLFSTILRVPTIGAAGDSITLTVTATDIHGVQGSGQRTIGFR
jgi:hypothetical protein